MMITEIETYFARGCGRCDRFDTENCSTRIWRAGLSALRAICRSADLEETVKWGHPCYMHAGRNIAIIGAFRTDFRLSFFEAGLLGDPAGVLERQGPNTRYPDMIRFTSDAGPTRQKSTIRAYLDEAKDHARAGRREPKDTGTLDLPDELLEALDADPELSEAFHALTRGRQKSYVINLNGARTRATRISRIARLRPRILAGKGATER